MPDRSPTIEWDRRGRPLVAIATVIVVVVIGWLVVRGDGEPTSVGTTTPATIPPATDPLATTQPAPITSLTAAPAATTTTIVPLPAPLGASAVASAREIAAIPIGQVAITLGEAGVTTGATLTHVRFPLEHDGLAIAVPPLRVSMAADGTVISMTTPVDDLQGLQVARSPEVPPPLPEMRDVAAAHLETPTADVFDQGELWLVVGDELHAGRRVRVVDEASDQGFDLWIDTLTMTVVDVVPLRSVGFDCTLPATVEAPAACVGAPDPDQSVQFVEILGLEDQSGASGFVSDTVSVVALPDGASVAMFDGTGGDASTFAEADGRWDGDVESTEFAAANVYHWVTATQRVLADLGFDDLAEAEVVAALTERQLSGLAVRNGVGSLIFGRAGGAGDVHTAADAQVVVHEYAHRLLLEAAPDLAWSFLPEPDAFQEANSDLVAFFRTITTVPNDPNAFGSWLGRAVAGLPRLLDDPAVVSYPDDFYGSSVANPYVAGRVWTGAIYDAFEAAVVAAGDDVGECLPVSFCAYYADRFLELLVESWPAIDDATITLPEIARIVLDVNARLGRIDSALLEQSFADRGLLGEPELRPTVSVLVQHSEPGALLATFDVVDASGSVLCTVASDVPFRSGTAVADAAGCSGYLPATADTVWRATVEVTRDSDPGVFLSFTLTTSDTKRTVAPLNRAIAGGSGRLAVATIPRGANTDTERVVTINPHALSVPAIIEDGRVIVAVVARDATAQLAGFDSTSGAEIWAIGYDYGSSYTGIRAGFALYDGVVYSIVAGRSDTAVAAVEAATGEERWFQIIPGAFSVDICGSALCVVDADRTTTRHSLSDGSELPNVDAPSGISLSQIGTTFVTMSEGRTPVFTAWNPDTGAVVWQSTPAEEIGADTSGGWHIQHRPDLGVYLASIGPDSSLLSSTSGYTAAMDPDTGDVLWWRENVWIPTGFPSAGHVYVLTYRPSFGLSASVDVTAIERIDPLTGRALASFRPSGNALQTNFAFSPDGLQIWWPDASGTYATGHDMANDLALVGPAEGVLWKRLDRGAISIEGTDRQVPDGYGAINHRTGEPLATSDVPGWIGLRAAGVVAYVDEAGSIVIAVR